MLVWTTGLDTGIDEEGFVAYAIIMRIDGKVLMKQVRYEKIGNATGAVRVSYSHRNWSTASGFYSPRNALVLFRLHWDYWCPTEAVLRQNDLHY